MKIKEIIDIPEFIKYYNGKLINNELMTTVFCEDLMKIEFKNTMKGYRKALIGKYKLEMPYSKPFVSFYLNHTNRTNKEFYAKEIDELYPDISNEIFKIKMEDDTILDLIIENYSDEILTLFIV